MSPEPAVPHILTSGACQRYTVEREAAHALSERCLLPHPIGPYRLLVARAAMAFILVAAALWGLPWPSVALQPTQLRLALIPSQSPTFLQEPGEEFAGVLTQLVGRRSRSIPLPITQG